MQLKLFYDWNSFPARSGKNQISVLKGLSQSSQGSSYQLCCLWAGSGQACGCIFRFQSNLRGILHRRELRATEQRARLGCLSSSFAVHVGMTEGDNGDEEANILTEILSPDFHHQDDFISMELLCDALMLYFNAYYIALRHNESFDIPV